VLSLKLLAQLMQTKPSCHRTAGADHPRPYRIRGCDFHYPGMRRRRSRTSRSRSNRARSSASSAAAVGQTTITRLLQGLYQPQAGLVKIDGQD